MRLAVLKLLALPPLFVGCYGLGSLGHDDEECSIAGQERCVDDSLYECVEGFDSYEWVRTSSSCPGPPPPVVDPRCKHVVAYCESERVIVHCNGAYFSHRADCTEDPNLPDGSLCVEPAPGVALCTPHEDPELLCPAVERLHGYTCIDDDTLAYCSYGYLVELKACPDGYQCVVDASDDGCWG